MQVSSTSTPLFDGVGGGVGLAGDFGAVREGVGAGSLSVAQGRTAMRGVVHMRWTFGGGMPRVQPEAERTGVITCRANARAVVFIIAI